MKLNSVKPKGKDTEDGLRPGAPTIHLTHEHLKAMGHDTPLSHGTEVHFEGRGHVSNVSSGDGYGDGGEEHHMTIQFHHAGMEGEEEPEGAKSDLRDELTRNADKATKDGGKVKMAARRGDDAVTSRTQQAYKDRAGKAESSGAAKTEQTGAKPKVTG